MDYQELRKLLRSLNEDLQPSISPAVLQQVEPEIVVEPEPKKDVASDERDYSVYEDLDKVEPKNSRAKAAFISSAKENGTNFLLVIEDLSADPKVFIGRAAMVCKHNGKVVNAGVSFSQRASVAIPPNLFKMVPVRGSTMPQWVKAYLED